MAVYKDTNGTYKVLYYKTNFDGTRTQTTQRGFKKKSDAIFFDSLKKKNRCTQVDVSGISLEEFIIRCYYPYIEGELKTKSLITKKHMINTHLLNVNNKPIASFKNMRLKDITVETLRSWQNAKKSEGYTDSYLLSMRKEISAILNFAEREFGWEGNPSKRVKRMGEFDTKVRKDDWWTVEEFDTFIDTIDKDTIYYVIWNVLFYSGIRLGELLALKRDSISIDNNCLYIDETYSRLNKEDIVTSPKTKESRRPVYIPQETTNIIKSYLDRYPDIGRDDRIFPIVHRTVEKALARSIKKTNLRYITVHCLRHSHVAYLKSLGVEDMGIIAKRVGHKDENITAKVYAHVYNRAEINVAQAIQNNINERKNDRKNDRKNIS